MVCGRAIRGATVGPELHGPLTGVDCDGTTHGAAANPPPGERHVDVDDRRARRPVPRVESGDALVRWRKTECRRSDRRVLPDVAEVWRLRDDRPRPDRTGSGNGNARDTALHDRTGCAIHDVHGPPPTQTVEAPCVRAQPGEIVGGVVGRSRDDPVRPGECAARCRHAGPTVDRHTESDGEHASARPARDRSAVDDAG